MRRIQVILTMFIVSGTLLMSQCEKNIFSFSAPDKTETGLIEEGKTLMTEGKYADAAAKFAEAMQQNPNSTSARYYHAKASLHASGFNSISLGNLLTKQRDAGSTPVPLMDLPKDSSNILYQVNNVIINDLSPIADSTITGKFTAKDINLDMTIATTVSGILSFKDTNNDGAINAQDVDLSVLFNNNGDIQIDDLQQLAENPGDLNGMIDNVDSLIANAGDLIGNLLGDSASGFDSSQLDSLIADISATARFYYVNSGEAGNPGMGDNDGDAYDVNGNGILEPTQYTSAAITRILNGGTPEWLDQNGNPITRTRVINEGLTPPNGDWASGDWGVDDELLDGHDNDGDGLSDEDSFAVTMP